jgi:hypothetical protein
MEVPMSDDSQESFERAARGMIGAVVEWWRRQPGAVAAALVGSYARGEATSESDIDLILLCEDPGALLEDTGWVRQFGAARSVTSEGWGNVTSVRVRYPGCEVEFGLADAGWASDPGDPGVGRVVRHGIRIEHDPSGVLAARVERILASWTGA